MRKQILAIALCVLLVAAAFTACSNGTTNPPATDNSGTTSNPGSSSEQQPANTDPLHFAHIIPLTGDKEQYGKVQQNAMNPIPTNKRIEKYKEKWCA